LQPNLAGEERRDVADVLAVGSLELEFTDDCHGRLPF
jgi:hypothetical protein